MAAFADRFDLTPTQAGHVLTATGDWHGDPEVLANACFDGGDKARAIAVLAALHGDWEAWRGRIIAATEAAHGPAGAIRLAAVHGYDGEGMEGYFEIEFFAPALFGEDPAMAVGTLADGIDDVGVTG